MTTIVTPQGLIPLDAKSFPLARAVRPSKTGPNQGRIDLLLKGGWSATFEWIWKSQIWPYVMVNKLTKGIARLPLKTFRYLDDEGRDRERVKDHPLAELLEAPWPGASAWDLKAEIVWSLAVHGNSLVVKNRPRAGAPPAELWPIPWRHIEVVYEQGVVSHYVFHGEKSKVAILPDDVIRLKLTGGVSPLEPLAATLGLEDAAMRWASNHFKLAGTPSSVFQSEKKLDEQSIPRIREELQHLYGGVENAGRFAILDQGLKVETLEHSAVDTALIEQRKLSREEVAAAYDMPPPVVGILDRATFSNVSELHRALYIDTIGPWLTNIESAFMAQLVRPEQSFQGVFTEFDLGEVLKGDVETRSAAYQRFMQSGVYTVNELRRLENLPPLDDPQADTVLLPLNMVPLGTSDESISARARLVPLNPLPDPPPSNGHTENIPAPA